MIKAVILDLDGTLYTGDRQVPGAAAFVRYLKQRAWKILYVTNRANRTPAAIVEHLRGYDIDCMDDDVLTSAQATAAMLPPGRCYCIGEAGMLSALESYGHTLTEECPETVIVSYDRGFNYEKLEKACTFIYQGARFVATNPDCKLTVEGGVLPGTGAIVAAVAAGSGCMPMVIGKPERHIIDMALKRLDLPADRVLMVGDNLDTDIAAGNRAGALTALILTGVSTREEAESSMHTPTWIVENYLELQGLLDEHADS